MSEADAECELRINLMPTQIELYKAQLRWEPWKAVAAMVATSAVMLAAVLGLSNWLHPAGSQQPMFPPGTVITIPAAPQK